jgi:hypothetical protein
MRRFSLIDLINMPTLEQGHFDNLKVKTDTKRVWLSRMTVADGAEYDNQVTVEKLVDGIWTIKEQYQAS